MASTDAIPVPRKNTAYRFYFAIRKPSDSTLITTWTGMDSEVSLDGAAFADCTNEVTEIGTSGCGYIDLTAAEMNADSVILKVTVTNTGAVPLVFTFLPETAGDYRLADTQKVDVETIKTQAVTCAAGVTVLASVGTAATSTAQTGDTYALANGSAGFVAIDTVVDAIKAKTDNLPTDPADQSAVEAAITAATGPLATAGNLATVAGYLDTEIAAILADTNELQLDWQNGGRLDLILDARASQTSVDDLPTNVELATALGTGAWATALPWNAAWDAEVQSEVNDGLVAFFTSAAALVDLMWDELLAGHVGAGSAGLALSTASSGGVDPSVLADAIWDEVLAGHATAGSAGKALTDTLADTNELQVDWVNGGRLDLILDAADLWSKRAAVLTTGLLTGAGTNTEVYTISALGITATCTTDSSGNRSAVIWS